MPVKRPKNSNLFAGRFLPDMRRAHSPGQEMEAPVFAEDFISRYEDARWISAVWILATLNTKLTDEVMEITINAFPTNAEKHHVKLVSPLWFQTDDNQKDSSPLQGFDKLPPSQVGEALVAGRCSSCKALP
ncbi:hypothetical protein HG530_012654 [Fusarium avenaceum]|nr:hypothetical protein HG530_012654 [Fusarium avenaceum]